MLPPAVDPCRGPVGPNECRPMTTSQPLSPGPGVPAVERSARITTDRRCTSTVRRRSSATWSRCGSGCPQGAGVDTVRVRVIRDAEPTFVEAKSDGVDRRRRVVRRRGRDAQPGHQLPGASSTGARSGYSWLNGTGEHHRDIPDAHDFRLTTFDPGPDWALDAVVYQVFPDRFARSGRRAASCRTGRCRPTGTTPVIHQGPDTPRQFFGGDLDGVGAAPRPSRATSAPPRCT